ncbi:hypothetical protein CEXT_30851 [Caerostris extrusa]|uniref:Uncharacterized protein n=1 Tax=Caerostris extrusa TaxID=172846 RepID=A0AAV4XQT8_CAEEX|nr:hypothetical protein CEXT_30851 [Caerostris extrusa]
MEFQIKQKEERKSGQKRLMATVEKPKGSLIFMTLLSKRVIHQKLEYSKKKIMMLNPYSGNGADDNEIFRGTLKIYSSLNLKRSFLAFWSRA